MINSEDDVRAWVRLASGGKARWIEPALGSTPGLPDCWVPYGGEGEQNHVHLELKAGVLVKGEKCSLIKYDVRPEQRREIRRMVDDGVPVGLVIGIKGHSAVVFALPNIPTLKGKIPIAGAYFCQFRAIGDGQEFWSGVDFLYSDRLKPKVGWQEHWRKTKKSVD